MGNVLQFGAKALALHDIGRGRIAVRMANPLNQAERDLEMVLPDFDAAQAYADHVIDRCDGFYQGVIDMTGGVND